MLKKILLGFAALFLLAVVVVGWRVWPIYQLTREISPSTAPEDYAKQDDSRVQLPTPRELEPRHFNPLKNAYWGEAQQDLLQHRQPPFKGGSGRGAGRRSDPGAARG